MEEGEGASDNENGQGNAGEDFSESEDTSAVAELFACMSLEEPSRSVGEGFGEVNWYNPLFEPTPARALSEER
jgi:hypothetical protein